MSVKTKHHATPGGFLYCYTLKNSEDWKSDKDEQIYKHGKTTKNMKEHLLILQDNYPTKEIHIIWMYKLSQGLDSAEKTILHKIQEDGYMYDSKNMEMSGYFTHPDISKYGQMLFDNFANKCWTECDIIISKPFYTIQCDICKKKFKVRLPTDEDRLGFSTYAVASKFYFENAICNCNKYEMAWSSIEAIENIIGINWRTHWEIR